MAVQLARRSLATAPRLRSSGRWLSVNAGQPAAARATEAARAAENVPLAPALPPPPPLSAVAEQLTPVANSAPQSLLARYEALVAAGTLRFDSGQAAAVLRLDRLCIELGFYSAAVEQHQQALAAWRARREAARPGLQQEEEQRLDAEQQAAAAAAEAEGQAGSGGLLSWLATALGARDSSSNSSCSSASSCDAGGAHSTGSTPHTAARQQEGVQGRRAAARGRGKLTRQQRAAVLSSRVEVRLAEEVGPPPPPPPAPRGVYLHGSVGSGKSLLMDLLFATATGAHYSAQQHEQGHGRRGRLSHARRLHFNSALLELHSRMHAIERQRQLQEEQQMQAYAAAMHQEQQQREQQREHRTAGESAEPASSSSGTAEQAWNGISVLKGVFDPMAEKFKRTKLARLAARRLERERRSRTPQQHAQAVAAANSEVLLHASRALIRNCDTLELMSDSRAAGGARAGAGDRLAALLCFDEVQAADTFAVAALKGLFEGVLAEGCVVVATSNRAPWELSRQGLHEDMHSHLVSSLMHSCDVVQLDAAQDYRRLLAGASAVAPTLAALSPASAALRSSSSGGVPRSYFWPLGPASSAALQQEWQRVTRTAAPDCSTQAAPTLQQQALPAPTPMTVPVMFGRTLHVPKAAGGAAWFSFQELCARPLGPADYLAVARAFHTLFLEGVPAMSMRVRDQARRFITLLDECYNHRLRLVCTAEAPPDALFTASGRDHMDDPLLIDLESLQFESAVEGSRLRRNLMAEGGVAPVAATPAAVAAASLALGGAEERFAFARAASRLHEMQSELYLSAHPSLAS